MAKSTEALLGDLVDSTKRSNKLLAQGGVNNVELLKSMRSLNKSVQPIGTLVKAGMGLLNLLGGAVLKWDKIVLQNSDLNVNARKLLSVAEVTAIRVGSFEDHLMTTLRLQRIGFKNIDVGFKDSLVLLDNQGEQGKLLVDYMAKLSATGATNRSVEAVARAVMEVSNHTGTTARASIASMEQMGDLVPLFKTLGIEGDVLKGLVAATADMSHQGAIEAGKLVKELFDPSDIKKSFLVGGIQFGDQLLESVQDQEGPKAFRRILKEAATSISSAGRDLMSPFGDSVIVLQKATGVLYGDLIRFAQSTENAFAVAKSTAKQLSKASGLNIDAIDSYMASTKAALDTVKRVAEFGTWSVFAKLETPLTEFNTALQKFVVDFDIYTVMHDTVNTLADVATLVRGILESRIGKMIVGDYVGAFAGPKSWTDAAEAKSKIDEFNQFKSSSDRKAHTNRMGTDEEYRNHHAGLAKNRAAIAESGRNEAARRQTADNNAAASAEDALHRLYGDPLPDPDLTDEANKATIELTRQMSMIANPFTFAHGTYRNPILRNTGDG